MGKKSVVISSEAPLMTTSNNSSESIYIGSTAISDIYIGSTQISEIYIGSTKIY